MEHILLLTFLIISCSLTAQNLLEDFESFDLPDESFLNGSNNPGGFTSNSLNFSNVYDANYDFWYGWAISNVTDNTTPGFMNQYGSITGSGAEGSKHFAVSYDILGENTIEFDSTIHGAAELSLYITNATYPFLSMRDGDGFAKKFGGEDGNDPDFFSVTIRAYRDGVLSQDSVVIFLADYRFDDNSMDYILDEWVYVDLSSLGKVDALSFVLNSSDVGNYGINTPGYFCVDNISLSIPLSAEEEDLNSVNIFPNPTANILNLNGLPSGKKTIEIYNMIGQRMISQNTSEEYVQLNLQALQTGTYYLNILSSQGKKQFTFFKSEN